MYDERLNNSVLANLDKAPLFLLGFGYWMLTNLQLISNDHLTPVARKSDPFMAGHSPWSAISVQGALESGPAGALLIFFFCYFIYLFLTGPLEFMSNLCCKSMMLKGFEINEEIDLYQNCLDDDDK